MVYQSAQMSFSVAQTDIQPVQSIELKLVDSRHEASGFLLGRYRSTDEWGAICSNEWDDRDARVACRHLGFRDSICLQNVRRGSSGTVPNSTFLWAVGCYGHETKLSECELVPGNNITCPSVAYIECVAGLYIP